MSEERISNDFLLAAMIHFFNNKKKEEIWFNKLVGLVDNQYKRMAKNTVAKNIDKLFDFGIIHGEWKDNDGTWIRAFSISGEASVLVENIWNDWKDKDVVLKELNGCYNPK